MAFRIYGVCSPISIVLSMIGVILNTSLDSDGIASASLSYNYLHHSLFTMYRYYGGVFLCSDFFYTAPEGHKSKTSYEHYTQIGSPSMAHIKTAHVYVLY